MNLDSTGSEENLVSVIVEGKLSLLLLGIVPCKCSVSVRVLEVVCRLFKLISRGAYTRSPSR